MATTARNEKAIPKAALDKSFYLLLGSAFLLTIGNKVYELLLPLIIYEWTHSSVAMASMRTAELLPNLFLGIFIGVIVDRANKKKWVLSMIGSQTILLFYMSYIVRSENTSLLLLFYLIGFLLMTCNYGYFNAQVSVTKLTVPAVQLTSANAKFSFIETFIGIMGPGLTGIILLFSYYNGLLFTAVVYMISFLLVTQLHLQKRERSIQNRHFLSELKDGWHAFYKNKPLAKMSIFILLLNSSMTVVSTTVIFFAKDDLHLSSSVLAYLLSVEGFGGLAASLLVSRFRRRFGLGILFGLSAIINALSYLGMYLSFHPVLLTLALFINGFATTIYSVTAYTFRQEQTPTELIGRISGITGSIFRIGMPISMALSGYMILWWGSSSVFLAAFVFNVIIFLFYRKSMLWRAE
ncbi:MFS transporter [Neobacillus jeddahensis]|uniref:MFS transporter n=1 Tax=Neobacillus jeddahensis TaxID=1461580 RepID=UPI00058CEB4B|nr:MFS transporter [Neobacillus jeddahensis]